MALDVGEFPQSANGTGVNDPQEIVNIVAHLVARIADRFSFLRKWSRNSEGTDKKAGLMSDVFSATVALYERNPEVTKQLVGSFASDVQRRRAMAAQQQAQRAAQQNGAMQ